jgi:hypothetical protein
MRWDNLSGNRRKHTKPERMMEAFANEAPTFTEYVTVQHQYDAHVIEWFWHRRKEVDE